MPQGRLDCTESISTLPSQRSMEWAPCFGGGCHHEERPCKEAPSQQEGYPATLPLLQHSHQLKIYRVSLRPCKTVPLPREDTSPHPCRHPTPQVGWKHCRNNQGNDGTGTGARPTPAPVIRVLCIEFLAPVVCQGLGAQLMASSHAVTHAVNQSSKAADVHHTCLMLHPFDRCHML